MGKKVKTSPGYCNKCHYSRKNTSSFDGCSYYIDTGLRRGCEVGYCDKFKPKEKRVVKSLRIQKSK